MGTLAARTAIATGRPAAHLAPRWARIDALARALLDDPTLRARSRLRVAPSALMGAGLVRWLGPGDPFDDVHEADLTEPLPAILAAAGQWTAWTDVRAAAIRAAGREAGQNESGEPEGGGDSGGDADDLLLTLIDDGLLQSDLAPPIVGAPPGAARDRFHRRWR